jgi:hypothetical protein
MLADVTKLMDITKNRVLEPNMSKLKENCEDQVGIELKKTEERNMLKGEKGEKESIEGEEETVRIYVF